MAEAAIFCTGVGQVIGTALLIPQIPLVGGCVISAADTPFILFFRLDGPLRGLRAFDLFITVFVLDMFINFCIQLSFIISPVGDTFDGLQGKSLSAKGSINPAPSSAAP